MNPHIGLNFDDFLVEQGLSEEVSAAALKRIIAWQLREARKLQKTSKTTLVGRMHTSHSTIRSRP